MSRHLTPLDVCIALIAPLKDLGEIGGVNQKSAYNWRVGSGWRAAGDIPPVAARRILAHAEALGLGVEPRHLLCGAQLPDVEAILARRGMSDGDIARHLMVRGLSLKVAAE